MENNLAVFDHEQFGKIRVINQNGEPWFVAKDICAVFGDTDYRRSISRLDNDEKGVSPLPTPGGVQQMSIVNESGLYSLLFNMQPQRKSNQPVAKYQKRIASLKAFKRWVTHEVLPSIRKTGAYMTDATIDKIADDPNVIYQLAEAIINERNKRIDVEKKLHYLTPAVPYGTPSKLTGNPRDHLIKPYWRSVKTTVITETTEWQRQLFDLQ